MKIYNLLFGGVSTFSVFLSILSFLGVKRNPRNKLYWIFTASTFLFSIVTAVATVSLVEVPYIVGVNIENAKQTLQERGFNDIKIDPSVYDSGARVAKQSPSQGYRTRKTEIKLELEEIVTEEYIESTITEGERNDMTISNDDNTEKEIVKESEENEVEINEDLAAFDDTYESYFNLTETHSPDDAMNTCYINNWTDGEDIDVRGLTYEKGVLYEFNNTLALLGGSSADEIQSDLRFAFIPDNPKPNVFRAKVVLHNDSAGTSAFAKLSVIVDDEKIWESEEVNGNTIKEIPIEVDLLNMEYYFTIHIDAMPYGDGIKFGIVDYKFE